MKVCGSGVLGRLLANPHLYSATILARVVVLFAMTLWGGFVLVRPESINGRLYPMYDAVLDIAPAEFWAIGWLIFCIFGFLRLWWHSTPHPAGALLYGTLMLWWTYIATGILFLQETIPPAGAACITTVAAVSVFAFVSNPKKGNGHGDS